MTERKRQHEKAIEVAARNIARTGAMHNVWRYHFACDDGEWFDAIAPTESGAFRVLNAERPGMMARLVERSPCGLDSKFAWARAHGQGHVVLR